MTESRSLVSCSQEEESAQEEDNRFGDDEIVLQLNCGDGYMNAHICQNSSNYSTKMYDFYFCKLYSKKADKREKERQFNCAEIERKVLPIQSGSYQKLHASPLSRTEAISKMFSHLKSGGRGYSGRNKQILYACICMDKKISMKCSCQLTNFNWSSLSIYLAMDRKCNGQMSPFKTPWRHRTTSKQTAGNSPKQTIGFLELEGKIARLIARWRENSKMYHAITIRNFMRIPIWTNKL